MTNKESTVAVLRTAVRGAYDLQRLRIEAGNRLCAQFRAKLGIDPNIKPEEDPKALKDIEGRYRLITDGVIDISRRMKFEYDGVISEYSELSIVSNYLQLKRQEERQFRDIGHILEDIPIWNEFLVDVRGCGPAMAGVIISEIDISKAKYASSLSKYAGLDVASDGRGRSRRKEHLIDVEYKDKDGKQSTRKSITFNPFLKTKLIGVLGTSFLRSGGEYKDIYDGYKHRIENMPAHVDKTKGHRHNMSVRYCVKIFLSHLYAEWRALEGLPVHPPYAEAKLGLVHGPEA